MRLYPHPRSIFATLVQLSTTHRLGLQLHQPLQRPPPEFPEKISVHVLLRKLEQCHRVLVVFSVFWFVLATSSLRRPAMTATTALDLHHALGHYLEPSVTVRVVGGSIHAGIVDLVGWIGPEIAGLRPDGKAHAGRQRRRPCARVATSTWEGENSQHGMPRRPRLPRRHKTRVPAARCRSAPAEPS